MEALMFSPEEAKELADHFGALVSKVPLHPLSTEDEYDEAVRVLNALLDAGGANEEHELAPLVVALGEFIGDYEDANHKWDDLPPNVVLRELMAMNGINQAELPEVGSQGVVSEILAGKRELTRKHIQAVSQRFHVSPAIFFPNV
jgi:HTH-type transcriptional regulator/antitoxin HigA